MTLSAHPAHPHSGYENLIALLSIIAVLIIGGMVATFAREFNPVARPLRLVAPLPTLPDDPSARHELQFRFDQGLALLHAKRFDFAGTAFARVVELAPRMPEARVNLGFALLGEKKYQEAGELFNSAVNLRPEQANAYWGLALALEGLQDYEGALGAMRTYIHLSTVPNDPFLPKARSALWEWEAQLGRIPNGEPPQAHGPQPTPPGHPAK